VWEESQLIEEILKLSQISRWDIGVGGTEEAAHLLGCTP